MSKRMSDEEFDARAPWCHKGKADRHTQDRIAKEAKRARFEEDRLLEERVSLDAKVQALAVAYVMPSLLAWRAESPNGFSRVYADDVEQARERGALAQRCEVSAITVSRWPEEDLCKARAVKEIGQALSAQMQIDEMRQDGLRKKDATIKALADALEAVKLWDAATREHPEFGVRSPMGAVDDALRLCGRLK